MNTIIPLTPTPSPILLDASLAVLDPAADVFDDELPAAPQPPIEVINIDSNVTAPVTPTLPVAPLPPLDMSQNLVERRQMLIMIGFYRERHIQHLKSISFIGLESMSNKQLQDLLADIQLVVSISSFTNTLHNMSEIGLNLFRFVDTNLTGLDTALALTLDYKSTLDEIGIIYSSKVSTDPLTRLMYIVGTTACNLYMTNQNNKQKCTKFLASNMTTDKLQDQYKAL